MTSEIHAAKCKSIQIVYLNVRGTDIIDCVRSIAGDHLFLNERSCGTGPCFELGIQSCYAKDEICIIDQDGGFIKPDEVYESFSVFLWSWPIHQKKPEFQHTYTNQEIEDADAFQHLSGPIEIEAVTIDGVKHELSRRLPKSTTGAKRFSLDAVVADLTRMLLPKQLSADPKLASPSEMRSLADSLNADITSAEVGHIRRILRAAAEAIERLQG